MVMLMEGVLWQRYPSMMGQLYPLTQMWEDSPKSHQGCGQAQEAGQCYPVVPEVFPSDQLTCVLLSRAQNLS